MMRNTLQAVAVLVAASMAISGCKHKGAEPTVAPIVKVDVMVVGGPTTEGAYAYSGTVSSASTTTVSFSVPGTIAELTAKEGQAVGKGQVLGKLKTGDYTNADNIARAELAEAEDAYNRLKKLHDANALPEIKWVEICQKLQQARNAAEISARALGETVLRAPMSGVISKKYADVGQNVAPVEPVFSIVSTDNLTVDISVPETEIGKFSVGQRAMVKFDGKEPVEGKVTQKSVVADPLTRSYTVKVAIPQTTTSGILPGMVGSVTFEPQADAPTTEVSGEMLPSQAVCLADDNRTFVWIVEKGVAQRRFVVADELVATGVMVKEGLAAGDSVVVAGMQKIGTGSKVDVAVKTNSYK